MDSPENNFSLTEAVSFRKPWKVREITAYKENLGEDSGAGYAAAQGSSQRTIALSARSHRALGHQTAAVGSKRVDAARR